MGQGDVGAGLLQVRVAFLLDAGAATLALAATPGTTGAAVLERVRRRVVPHLVRVSRVHELLVCWIHVTVKVRRL